ncbi:MAG: MATE family efflux transporter [Lachnospiraceae bacterium]
MKQSACLKEFMKYVSLNVMGMIGLSCYILADTFFVAKGLGADGLTALNLAIPIYSFIHGSGLMFGMGGATKYAIAKSQKNKEHGNRIFTNTVLLAVALAVVFFAVGLFLSGTIAKLLGADEAVYQMSRTYLQMILLFAPMFMMNNVLLCFVRNDGAPQLSMMAMIGGSLSNIVLDYIFIFPFGMGIFGAVLATGIAPVISMLILSPHLISRKNQFHLKKCGVEVELSGQIVSGGLPSLITEMSSGIVIIVFNIIILRLQGNIGVAAYGVIANLSLVVISVYTGIAQGIQPIISRIYGIGNKENIRLVLRYALISAVVVSVLVYGGVFFGAEQIAWVFNQEQNEVLQQIAVYGLRIYFTACMFAGVNIILAVYFTSTEDARPANVISVLRGFVVIIPMALLLSAVGGMTGVWCVFPATEILVCAFAIWLLWKKTPIEKEHVF